LSENPASDASEAARQAPQGKLPILGLSALGIVFGDIGTSPLYTFKTILGTSEGSADASIARWARFRSCSGLSTSLQQSNMFVRYARRQ